MNQKSWEGEINTLKKMTDSIVSKGFSAVGRRMNSLSERLQLNQTIQDIKERDIIGQVNKLANQVAYCKAERDYKHQEVL